MCKDENAFKSRSADAKDNGYIYLRDYLGRSISNCQRIEVDEHVSMNPGSCIQFSRVI